MVRPSSLLLPNRSEITGSLPPGTTTCARSRARNSGRSSATSARFAPGQSTRSLDQVFATKRLPEQGREGGFNSLARIADADHRCPRAEFADHLAAGPARGRGPFRRRVNNDGPQFSFARGGRAKDGGSFGAVAQAVGCVFDV